MIRDPEVLARAAHGGVGGLLAIWLGAIVAQVFIVPFGESARDAVHAVFWEGVALVAVWFSGWLERRREARP